MNDRPVIAVFGSSSPQPGSAAYETAREVGRLLAQRGYAVATGAYGGTMAAVSQGAAEAGGHVIGATSDVIEAYRGSGPNQWVQEAVRFSNLRDRLTYLVTVNDGMITLPGGIGTLSEMALAWSLLQVSEIAPRPLVLLGQMWQDTVSAFVQPEYVHERHMRLLRCVLTPVEAVETLHELRLTGPAG